MTTPYMGGMFPVPRLPAPTKLFVDFDPDAVSIDSLGRASSNPTLLFRVGPKGKPLVASFSEIIRLAAARCGRY